MSDPHASSRRSRAGRAPFSGVPGIALLPVALAVALLPVALAVALLPVALAAQDPEQPTSRERVGGLASGEADPDAGGTLLRWALRPGMEWVYRQTDQFRTANIYATVTETRTFTLRHRVEGVGPDGAADVAVTYDRVELSTEFAGLGRTISFDSAEPGSGADLAASESPVLLGLAVLAGKEYRMRLAPDGTVVEVAGHTELVDVMVTAVTAAMGTGEGQNFRISMFDMFSDDGMRKQLQARMGRLPPQGVQPGDTWMAEEVLPNPMTSFKLATTYTLAGIQHVGAGRVARVDFTGILTAEPIPGIPESMAPRFSQGRVSGSYAFEPDGGLLTDVSSRSNITVTQKGIMTEATALQTLEMVEVR